jgi:outer membrane receptor for ferrienterochelin and colicin
MNLKRLFYFIIFLSLIIQANAQKYTISGYVEDSGTGEKIFMSNVYNSLKMQGTASNAYGFYSLSLPGGEVKLVCSYVGYKAFVLSFQLHKDTVINIQLNQSMQLQEVVVKGGGSNDNLRSSQMSINEISLKTVKSLPAFLGEVDPIKILQLLPGVQTGTEGSTGLYVRGGGPDQNLILLDGVPVYNASHLFGFFSVFNADALNTITLIKGGFPARYGGRLSSVLDIRMKEGNMKQVVGEGSIGLVTSRFTLEGPIIKDKASFIISARRTLLDLWAKPLAKKITPGEPIPGYYFYDLNAKLNYKFSEKDRLYLSAYAGDDLGTYNESSITSSTKNSDDNFKLTWGNLTTALRWNHLYNSKLFSNTTLTISRYNFEVNIRYFSVNKGVTSDYESAYNSGIHDAAAKIDFDYIPAPGHYIRFGISNTLHDFNPGVIAYDLNATGGVTKNNNLTYGGNHVAAQEQGLYVEDDYQVTQRLKMNMGLHFSGFAVQDQWYNSLQPRLSLNYIINDRFSLKAAYSDMTQYLHLLSNSNIGLPTDLWLPSTNRVKPMNSKQYALGFVYAINQMYQFSFESFYKYMKNMIEYKEGAVYWGQYDDWQDKIETGDGWSYGSEFLLEKKTGKTTGWIGYTLSWNNRKFANINSGKTFPARYDERHDLSVVVNHQFNQKVDMGLTWVYSSGPAFTLNAEEFLLYSPDKPLGGNTIIQSAGAHNGFRMPAYHRLDLGFNFHKKKRWGERVWRVGVYNLYSRRNPFFIYTQNETSTDKSGIAVQNLSFKQVSLFPIIPSVTYSFSF